MTMGTNIEKIRAANERYAAAFGDKGRLPHHPVRRFAVVTCMDCRLDPAKFAGIAEGDAHVIRNERMVRYPAHALRHAGIYK